MGQKSVKSSVFSLLSRHYILFKTGLRISEFCGLTISDIDFKEHTINIDHQLQKKSKIGYYIQETKTTSGTRKIPMTADVEECFRVIRQIKRCRFHQIKTGLSEHLTMG